jgi:hypothetical protein
MVGKLASLGADKPVRKPVCPGTSDHRSVIRPKDRWNRETPDKGSAIYEKLAPFYGFPGN